MKAHICNKNYDGKNIEEVSRENAIAEKIEMQL